MANRQFLGTTNTDFATASNWDGGSSLPSASDNLQISSNCILPANDSNVYGTLLIDSSKTFNIQTYNFSCGAITINGILKISNSSANGLTCGGLDFKTGAKFDIAVSGKVHNSGNINITDNTTWQVSKRGDLIQTASANYSGVWSNASSWAGVTLSSSVTLSMVKNTMFIINGIHDIIFNNSSVFNINSYTVILDNNSSNLFKFDTNADITGTGKFKLLLKGEIVLVNNRTSPFSITGSVGTATSGGLYSIFPAWDFSNADVLLGYSSNSLANRHLSAGTLKCKKFSIIPYSTITQNIKCTGNPNFEISSDVLFDDSVATINYTRGTGTITLLSGNANIDFSKKLVEKIIINTTGTKTFTDNFSTSTFTLTSGTADFSSISSSSLISDLVVNGTLKLDDTEKYVVTNISGSGTLENTGAGTVYLYYKSSNTFSGTLTNVVLVKVPNNKCCHYLGLGLRIKL